MRKLSLVGVVVFATLLAAHSQAQTSLVFTTLDFPGSVETRLRGVNDKGQIVGVYRKDVSSQLQAFLFNEGQFTRIDLPGSISTRPTGINNAGDICGNYSDASGNPHAFLLSRGTLMNLVVLGSVVTEAFGLNDKSDVVGFFSSDGVLFQGYEFTNGTYTTVTSPSGTFNQDVLTIGINDADAIIGSFVNSANDGVEGFVLSNGAVFSFQVQNVFTSPTGINAQGTVTGTYAFTPTDVHGFLVEGWIFTEIQFPGATITAPRAVNTHGVIVGNYIGTDGRTHGMIVKSAPEGQ
jgi:probable HAF family extracellular repeat protein